MCTMTISETVKFLRKERNLTQVELAAKLNVSQTSIMFIETGKRTPSKEIAKRMSRFFKTPISVFLGESDFDAEAIRGNAVVVPYMNSTAAAGNGFYNDTEYINQFITITEGRILDALRNVKGPVMLSIKGESMLPTLSDRNLVIVAPEDKEIEDNKIYVFTIGDQSYIKRLYWDPIKKKIICKSDNTLYPVFEVDPPDITIHGRVISHLFLDL